MSHSAVFYDLWGKKSYSFLTSEQYETRIASLLLVASTLRCMYFPTLNHFVVYESLLLHIPCFLVSCTFNSHLLISCSLWLASSTNEGIFSHSSRQCVGPFLFPPPLPYPFLPSFNLAPTSCFHYNDFFTCQLSYSSYFFLQIYPQELYCSKCHFCSREGRLYRGKLKLLLSE